MREKNWGRWPQTSRLTTPVESRDVCGMCRKILDDDFNPMSDRLFSEREGQREGKVQEGGGN
jgi:hypothetical protein